jgi:hypothetical protein
MKEDGSTRGRAFGRYLVSRRRTTFSGVIAAEEDLLLGYVLALPPGRRHRPSSDAPAELQPLQIPLMKSLVTRAVRDA